MKNKVSQGRTTKILLALLALFTVQANCDGVNPNDERIQPASQVQIYDQELYLYQLSIINIGLPPPRIVNPESPYEGTGESTVSGYSINRSQLQSRNFYSVNPLSTELKVRLYKLAISNVDCNDSNRLVKAELIGEVELNESGKWEIKTSLTPNSFFAATISTGTQESGLSNIIMVSDSNAIQEAFFSEKNGWGKYKDAIKLPLEGMKNGEDEYIPFTISGRGFSGWCVRARFENSTDGASLEWSRTSVDAQGNWSLSVPIMQGGNHYTIEVLYPNKQYEPISSARREINLVGIVYPDFNPVWPFGSTNQDGVYVPQINKNKINAWFGPNDFHKDDTVSRGYHDGLDIGAASGTKVHAIASGCVYQIRTSLENAGWAVFIDHGNWVSYYYHLKEKSLPEKLMSVPVRPNTSQCVSVNAGEEIGEVGGENHLHVSAFYWGKNNRYNTLKDTAFLQDIGGGLVRDVKGRLINVNPAKDDKLGNNKLASEVLYTCVGSGFWGNLDWSKIPISRIDGTSFNYLSQQLKIFSPDWVYWQNCLKTPAKR